jgi:hypothetical protein
MRPLGVVVDAPALDHDLSLPQAVEELPIEQLVSHPTSVTPIERTASATGVPWAVSTSTWRSFETISSGLGLFFDIDPSSSGQYPYFRMDHSSEGGSHAMAAWPTRPAPVVQRPTLN